MKAKILIGLPASGKTTWIKENRQDELVINCDSIRMMLQNTPNKYEAFVAQDESIVWNTFCDLIGNIWKSRKDIIIDNPNCNKKLLDQLLIRLHGLGYKEEFIVIDTQLQEIKERLKDYPHMQVVVENMNRGFLEVKNWVERG